MQKIYHKRNELLKIEFFKDKECTKAFDFTDAKDLYIELQTGDCTPAIALSNKLFGLNLSAIIYTPLWHLGYKDNFNSKILLITLNDIQCDETGYKFNLSKYIPEGNAVLFFDENISLTYFQDCLKYGFTQFYRYGKKKLTFAKHTHIRLQQKYIENYVVREVCDKENEVLIQHKKITIFIPHGTQAELQKANEVAKELKEKYGVEEVNVFVLHCFVSDIYNYNSSFADDFYKQNFQDAYDELCSIECKPNISKKEYKVQFEKDKLNHKQECYINKIITTNSTGFLKPKNTERLQVIDCFDIFNNAL